MAYNPPAKSAGNTILSADWNAATGEVVRLETAKLDHAGGVITGDLTVNGTLTATKVPPGTLPVSGLVSTKYVVPLNMSAGQTLTFQAATELTDPDVNPNPTGIFLMYFPVITTPNAQLAVSIAYVNSPGPVASDPRENICFPKLSYTNTSNVTLQGTLTIYAVKGQ